MRRKICRENDELELADSEVQLNPETEAEFADRVEDLADELDVPFALITNNICTTSDEITPSIDDAITVLSDELGWEPTEDGEEPVVLDVPNTNDDSDDGVYQSSEIGGLYSAVSSLDDDDIAVSESFKRRNARRIAESRRTSRKPMRRTMESRHIGSYRSKSKARRTNRVK